MEGSTGENVSTVVVQRHHCAVIVLFLKRHIQGLRKSSSHGPLSCLFRPLFHRDARESRFLLYASKAVPFREKTPGSVGRLNNEHKNRAFHPPAPPRRDGMPPTPRACERTARSVAMSL